MARDGRAALDLQIARLRALPLALTRDAAPAVARAVEAEIRAQLARGEGPGGKPWPMRKVDGGRPLRHAADAVTVTSVGDVIIVRLSGVEVRHHLGAVRGGVRRPIIPTGSLPDPLASAIETIVAEKFAQHMGAR